MYNYNSKNDVDKHEVQQELKLQHNTLIIGILKVNNWLDTQIIRNAKEDKNKVYNVSKKYIVKDTNKILTVSILQVSTIIKL